MPKGGPGEVGRARALGFKLTPAVIEAQPEFVGTRVPGQFREALANPGLSVRAQVENQQIANRHASKALGGKGTEKLPEQIKATLDAHSKVASEVADTVRSFTPDDAFRKDAARVGARLRDNPALENVAGIERLRDRLLNVEKLTGQQMLDAIREFRAAAKVSLQSLDDFAKHQTGRALREAADVLESALERAAAPFARPNLIKDFKASRVRAAQAHDLESATIGDNLSLSVLANIGPENLTGVLKSLARVGQEFPTLTKTQSRISPRDPQQSFVFSPFKRGAQRFGLAPKLQEQLLSEQFQSQFGGVAPEGGVLGPAAFLEGGTAPPAGSAGGGGLDFTPSGGVPPAAALRGGSRELELVPDPVAGALELPPATARPGDLTASVPPASRGDIPLTVERRLPASIGDDLSLTDDVGTFPGVRVPEEAALTEFVADQPFERRRLAAGDLGEVERRSSILRERQRVLDQPVGTPVSNLSGELLDDTAIRRAVLEDTRRNRLSLHPEDQFPPALTDREMLEIQLAPADLELQGIGREIQAAPSSADASIQAAIEELTSLGFGPEEIAEILARGQ